MMTCCDLYSPEAHPTFVKLEMFGFEVLVAQNHTRCSACWSIAARSSDAEGNRKTMIMAAERLANNAAAEKARETSKLLSKLRERIQRLESSIVKQRIDTHDKVCECEIKETITNKSSSGAHDKLCINCAGWDMT